MDKEKYLKPSILFREALCLEYIAANEESNAVEIPGGWNDFEEGDEFFG